MIEYLRGDLFQTKAEVIAHGVNCRGAFNAGVARQVRRLFPSAYAAYMEKLNKEGWNLGDVQFVAVAKSSPTSFTDDKHKSTVIANCATQRGYGYGQGQRVY